MDLSPSVLERFWSKVEKGSPGECWTWKGQLNGGRPGYQYGKLSVRQKWYGAHRISYFIAHGELPDNLLVCHHCDNPLCVNPDHLFLGTSSDNTKDMLNKGRAGYSFHFRRGEEHFKAKLTNHDIPVIRKRIANGERCADIAESFNVSRVTIWRIGKGLTWKTVH